MTTGRDRQREETRRRVYEAALQVFRRDGVDSARIDDIVGIAGVSRGTFYFHFPTKDDVLLELVRHSEESLCERIEAMPDDAPVDDVLIAIAEHMAQTWADDPVLLSDVGLAVLRNSARSLQAERDAHPARVVLVPRIEAAIARGELSGLLPADITTDFFLVNLFGAALAWVGNQSMPLDGMLEVVVQFFLKAARP